MFLFLQYYRRKIPQINKVCVDFLFLFNKKMGFFEPRKEEESQSERLLQHHYYTK